MEAAPAEDNDDIENQDGIEGFEDIQVNISSTKVNAVLTELAKIRKTSPEEKTIIVSQFTSLLSIFQVIGISDFTFYENTNKECYLILAAFE